MKGTPPSIAGDWRRFRLPEHVDALEQRYHVLFESSSDAIFLEDTKGRIVAANPAAERLTGLTANELAGRAVDELVASEWRERGRVQHELKLLGETRHTRHESVIVDRAGQRIPVEISSTLVQLDDGAVGVQAVVRDLSARRRADAALRESEERFRVAFDAAAVGMALTSIDGRWLKVNDAFCELVGHTAEELMTMTYQDITHPDDLGADLALGRQMLAGEIGSFQMEKRYRHKDGRYVRVLLSVALVRDADGAPAYAVAQVRDLSGRAPLAGPGAADVRVASLTRREREVLTLLARGSTSAQAASTLGIGEETVQTHIRRARVKLAARTRTEAVATATRLGLLDPVEEAGRAA
jgi:PAS domain S-box-containing protein